MPNRTAKFASAIFASLFAGLPLTTISYGAAADCLSEPKDQVPEGSHWYYRIDHPSNRHCWYLRREGEKSSQLTARPAPSKAEPSVRDSIADARAELPPQTRVEHKTEASVWPPVPAAPASAAGPENSPLANPPDANARPSVVASRWPEPSSVESSASPALAVENPGVTAPSNSPTTRPPVAAAAVSLAAADSSSSEKQSRSILMLLIAVVGALSFAGLMGRAIFRFNLRRRRARQRVVRGDRRAIWDSIVTDRPPRPAHAMPDSPIPRAPRDPRAADDPNRRIAEMLERLSRSAAA
ncbi:hypothetical protein [Bradyrhizobium sp.]|uniref:hypothetical protein n=1 Tax=Bradyrhizobium sp. TaxID=376 RepID=UPI0025C49C29|nr:hypothetical protein [Bradyrhizobium sp.]